MSAEFTSKNGFSVVAPTSTSTRFSTAWSSASCWLPVEAMDLVDEQDGSKALHRQALFRGADLAAQVGHGAADGGDFHKGGFRVLGDDVRERGLPRARGPKEDDRA